MSVNNYEAKYLKYKFKYFKLKSIIGGAGLVCPSNNNTNKHEFTDGFLFNYKTYKLSTCIHCDEYIYKKNDDTTEWSENMDEIDIDQDSLNSAKQPMIKEILQPVFDKKIKKAEDEKKTICANLKKEYDNNINTTTKMSPSAQTFVSIKVTQLKNDYKTNLCNDITGKLI